MGSPGALESFPSMRIKRRLVLLVVSVLAPMVMFTIITVVMLARQGRATQDRPLATVLLPDQIQQMLLQVVIARTRDAAT